MNTPQALVVIALSICFWLALTKFESEADWARPHALRQFVALIITVIAAIVTGLFVFQ